MTSTQKLGEQGWFYHSPNARSTAGPVGYPPLSQVPLIGHLNPDDCESTEKSNWIKDTDSKYVQLAKKGGRADLLSMRSFQPSSEKVLYPRCDWFYLEDIAKEREEGKSQIVEDSPGQYEFLLPDYMVDSHPIDNTHRGPQESIPNTSSPQRKPLTNDRIVPPRKEINNMQKLLSYGYADDWLKENRSSATYYAESAMTKTRQDDSRWNQSTKTTKVAEAKREASATPNRFQEFLTTTNAKYAYDVSDAVTEGSSRSYQPEISDLSRTKRFEELLAAGDGGPLQDSAKLTLSQKGQRMAVGSPSEETIKRPGKRTYRVQRQSAPFALDERPI